MITTYYCGHESNPPKQETSEPTHSVKQEKGKANGDLFANAKKVPLKKKVRKSKADKRYRTFVLRTDKPHKGLDPLTIPFTMQRETKIESE